jgi:hypothetical protein
MGVVLATEGAWHDSMVPRSKPIGACFELIVLGALAKIMAAEHVACSSVRAAGGF